MSAPLTAVLRCFATSGGGGGHVFRCLAIAEVAAQLGWDCAFLTDAETEVIVPQIGAYGRVVVPPACADLLVVDDYNAGAAWETASRAWAGRIVAIDDFPTRRHDCDVLADANPAHDSSDYVSLVPLKTRILTGPSYAPVRARYRRLRRSALARRHAAGPVRRVLVNFGAGDSRGLALAATRACVAALPDALVTVVAGAGCPHMDALRSIAAGRVALYESVDTMADLMAEADLAVGAAGHSSWERCALGLPSIVVPIVDNQRDNAKALAEAGAAVVAADADALDCLVADFGADVQRLRDCSARAAGLCDARGALRQFVAALPAYQLASGDEARLDLAEPADGDLLFAWQSDAQTRRFARNPAIPTRGEHEAWFDAVLDNPDRVLCLVRCDGEPAGSLRLDRDSRGRFEVSIYTAPSHYRRGVAGAALALAGRLVGGTLVAEVAPENTASIALFRSAGFVAAGERTFVRGGRGRAEVAGHAA